MFNLLTLAERQSLRIFSGELPKTMRKPWLSAKFPHQEIRWNYGIFRSAGVHYKDIHILKNCSFSAGGLFKYVWFFNEDRALKALRKKYPYLEFFWSVFSCIRIEYGEILHCIQAKCWKIRTRKTANTETFHAVRVNDCWRENQKIFWSFVLITKEKFQGHIQGFCKHLRWNVLQL